MNGDRHDDEPGRRSRAIAGDAAIDGGGPPVWMLIAYMLVVTLIAGAGDPGAGLAVFVLSLLTLVGLDFGRWQRDEARNRVADHDATRPPAKQLAAPEAPLALPFAEPSAEREAQAATPVAKRSSKRNAAPAAAEPPEPTGANSPSERMTKREAETPAESMAPPPSETERDPDSEPPR